MTLKAHANQQSTLPFFPGQQHGKARRPMAVPELRRAVRHSGQDAIVVPGRGDVNFNLQGRLTRTTEDTPEVYAGAAAVLPYSVGVGLLSAFPEWEQFSPTAALGDEDEDEDEDVDEELDDDDELDEDDDEDLEDEDEDFDDDELEDEDDEEDLDDDDLDDEDEDDED